MAIRITAHLSPTNDTRCCHSHRRFEWKYASVSKIPNSLAPFVQCHRITSRSTWKGFLAPAVHCPAFADSRTGQTIGILVSPPTILIPDRVLMDPPECRFSWADIRTKYLLAPRSIVVQPSPRVPLDRGSFPRDRRKCRHAMGRHLSLGSS